ncbi:hypothetical protein L1049_025072 [Liquidambar formosana]|uniref:Large ribosomal subunit protein uL30m n=1 Tax=Liquidambar formosana TaxID=63359 RepID=A0AAP0S1N3_LIQFO
MKRRGFTLIQRTRSWWPGMFYEGKAHFGLGFTGLVQDGLMGLFRQLAQAFSFLVPRKTLAAIIRGHQLCVGEESRCKRKDMNAFKAFKACVPIAWSPNLYITLVRGIPGTRRLHRRTLEALRLRKCNRTVMRWNTPTVRGMLQQVKRLVVIETEEMYKARKQKDVNHRALRPPLVIRHLPPPASNSA